MADVAQRQTHLLLLHRFKLVGEDVKFAADDYHREGQRLDLRTVLVLVPDLPEALLLLVEGLLCYVRHLLRNFLRRLGRNFPESTQPKEEIFNARPWVCEIEHYTRDECPSS